MTPVFTRSPKSPGTPALLRSQADESAWLSSPESSEAADPALNDIARLAAQLCRAPVAVISMLEADRLRYRATFGITAKHGDLAESPCVVPLANPDVYVMRDTSTDPRYAPNGILLGQRHFRFYAGTRLITPEGVAVGTLSVLDHQPRTLDRAQADALLILARQAITRLELTAKLQSLEQEARARQRVDQALNLERNFVSAVLDTMGTLVIVFDTAGRLVRFNRACEILSGSSLDELVGKPFWEKLVPEEDIEETIHVFADIRAGNVPTEFENRWITHEGLKRISWTGVALRDARGEVSYIIATGIDITAQREAQETLMESEARYRQLIEGSLGLICTHDLDGVVLTINAHAAVSLGYEVDEMTGVRIVDFIPERYQPRFNDYMSDLLQHGESQGLLHLNDCNGNTRVIAYRNKLIHVPGRDPFVLGHGIDITEKTRAEEALRGANRQVNTILESAGDGIVSLDPEGRITLINHAALEMLGYDSAEEVLGCDAHGLFHHSTADGMPIGIADCHIHNSIAQLTTTRVSGEVFWRKNGTSFDAEYVACPQIDQGRPVGTTVLFQDVTERRALERMKDEFISTVSHELRTPLTSVRAALGLIAGGALHARPEKAQQMLDVAVGNTDRLVSLVNDILDLERVSAGKMQMHRADVRIDELLQRAADLQHSSVQKNGIQFRIDAEPITVHVDPDRILQTLTNLLSNAIKFSPPGSEIRLIARATGPNEVRVCVMDRGRGIPSDKLETIFERFQQVDASDSRMMGGTGLGLAICRSIVEQHGGRIWAESTPGEGA
ncbi:MAG TPA: PAS domain S-box protein, partial [Acidobacteriaceae bacterium]|nr:PAS domain S-box protein [Acidobacteriaceae bacterium]